MNARPSVRTKIFTSGTSVNPTRQTAKSGKQPSTAIWRSRKSRAGFFPAPLGSCGFLLAEFLLLLPRGFAGLGLPPVGAAASDFDLPGFSFLAFGNRDLQHPVLESCIHVVRINVGGQRE